MKPTGLAKGRAAMWAVSVLALACSSRVPEEVRRAGPDNATAVRWDLGRGPSGVPWPNDSLCWADEAPLSPCRPNLPLVQQGPIVAQWISSINAERGWPTNGPIVIPFSRSPDAKAGPAIDLSWLLSLQEDADFSNDAIYLVDLETGLPQPLAFPTTHGSHIQQVPVALDLADPHRAEPSLLVETIDERYGSEGQPTGVPRYSTERDVDSDGLIDVPALLPGHPCTTVPEDSKDQARLRVLRDRCLADALVDTFDPGEDTLRVYPRSPLAEGKAYAVVITDRMLDNRGLPVRGPFSSSVHPAQRAMLQRLQSWLVDPKRAHYYGASSDANPNRIRFAWSFTTSSPAADLKRAFQRSQKHGSGASLAIDRQFDLDAACPGGSPRDSLSVLLRGSMGLSRSEGLALEESLKSIGSISSGTVSYDPFELAADTASVAANGRVSVPVWLTLPKRAPTGAIRVVIVNQARDTHHVEALRWAGQWASLGLATLTYARRHGVSLPKDVRAALEPQFVSLCSTDLMERLLGARDDAGSSDSTWSSDVSADVIRTRELWRREALELATLVNLLESTSLHAAVWDLTAPLSVAALVGIGTGAAPSAMAATLFGKPPALVLIDPATTPDRAWRRGATWSTTQSPLWEVFGPRLAGVSTAQLDAEATRCTANETSLRLVTAEAPLVGNEIACLPLRGEGGVLFPEGGTVIATNLMTRSRRCVRLNNEGEFSLGLPAAAGDELTLEIFAAPDLLQSFGRDNDCDVPEQAPPPVLFFGGGSAQADPSRIIRVPVGGLGLERQSSEFHRALDLAAAAFSSANPTPFVAALSQPERPTDSRGMLLVVSPGDPIVPPDEGLALAVAAKLVPHLPADAVEQFPELAAEITPTELANALRKSTAASRIEWARLDEGVPRLQRFPPDASTCAPNLTSDMARDELCRPTCVGDDECSSGSQCIDGRCAAIVPSEAWCAESLADVDSLANEESPFGAIRPVPYLRLARYAGALRTHNLKEMWQPQFRILGPLVQPLHPDWPIIALALPMASPRGNHGIVRDDLCHAFRFGNYVPYLLGHFVASSGTNYAPVFRRDTQQCLQDPRNLPGCDFVELVE